MRIPAILAGLATIFAVHHAAAAPPEPVSITPELIEAANIQGLPMRVARRTFLGPAIDLALEHPSGATFRASAPPYLAVPPDGQVFVELPAEKCRPLRV
jgi:hypothetical protein